MRSGRPQRITPACRSIERGCGADRRHGNGRAASTAEPNHAASSSGSAVATRRCEALKFAYQIRSSASRLSGTATRGEKPMPKVTRRTMLAGTAAAAVVMSARMTVTPARAAAPATGKQAPGFYRYKVGSYEITVVTDGARLFPLSDSLETNAQRQELSAP